MPYGIDFGTTNSAVVWDANTLLDVGDGRPFPSLVAIDKATGQVRTGRAAREQREKLEQEDFIVIPSVKKYLGRPMTWRAGGKSWTPRMIATELFKGIKQHATQRGDITRHSALDQAVVSIPIGFKPERRRELRAAAYDAGIEITDFISEPTAAFLHCRRELPGVSSVAVFDWGGGTLDVSVLEIDGHRIRELATEGLERAGDDIDRRIAAWVHTEVMRSRSATTTFDEVTGMELDRLLVQSERAKIELSGGARDKVALNLISYQGAPASVDLTRATLASLVEPFLLDAVRTLRKALARGAANSWTRRRDVDSILLVGGSSKLFGVYERLDELFPARVQRAERPDWAVGQGASELARRRGHYELMQRLCVVLSDGYGHDLVPLGARFGEGVHVHRLGIIEEADAAQLVFAESDVLSDTMTDTAPVLRQIGNLSVPVMGFDSEPIEVSAILTQELTLQVAARSLDGNKEDVRRWEYDMLRFGYVMPE